MKLYELTCLISSEENAKKLQEKITSLIQGEEGLLDKIEEPAKKKLGYKIKKQSTAHLVCFNFYLNPEKLKNLEKKLRAEKEILRFILLTKKVPKAKISIKPTWLPKIEELLAPEIVPPEQPGIKPKEEKKVELEEIEKKLEEILGK